MNINKAELQCVAVKPDQYPSDGKPEIAFAGRSNVGKSSLINAMLNRKALARTSGTPGKTRTINFYNADDIVYLVDLPGYGYAKLSRSESAKWGAMVETYLKRDQVKLCILLVDIRHEPTANDKLMYGWLKHFQLPTQVVATKADKIKRSALLKNISITKKTLELKDGDNPLPFSSETRAGRDELWEIIRQNI